MFKNPQMDHAELIAWALTSQKQTHSPGEHFAYSNFGYCVLGRVLEKVLNLPYEKLITQQVLSKCGITRMDSHGGWIATAGDLVRFASQLSILLSPDSIRAMTTHGISESYARGWNVNKVPNWWHGGSLPGTNTIMVHTAKGLCWVGLLNGRSEGLGLALDRLMWQMGSLVPGWKL